MPQETQLSAYHLFKYFIIIYYQDGYLFIHERIPSPRHTQFNLSMNQSIYLSMWVMPPLLMPGQGLRALV